MQLDTGASLSLMAETTFREHWLQRSLSSSQVRLCSYSGETIPVLGVVNVTCKGQSHQMPLIIVRGSGRTLMGRNWLQLFKLDWQEIYLLQNTTVNLTQQIVQKY